MCQPGRYSPAAARTASNNERIAELNAKTTVRIHFGCDFHLQFNNIEDALTHPEKYTINHKSYLLVEFPDLSLFTNTDEILGRLLDAGMVPIISHPERNALLRQRVEDIARWVASGCYVQVTASSYTGHFGRAAKASADDLLKHGLTHLIASDAHDCEFRPPTLSDAYSALADTWGEELIRPLFVENPKTVLTGQVLDFEFPSAAVRPRRWYRFFG